MTTGHTPGPWGHMAGMPTNVLDSSGMRVARCDFDGDFDHPEAHANAALIANAPQLLAENVKLKADYADLNMRLGLQIGEHHDKIIKLEGEACVLRQLLKECVCILDVVKIEAESDDEQQRIGTLMDSIHAALRGAK